MTVDFKKRHLKTLICSPMVHGTKSQLKTLLLNIIKFQNFTATYVMIIIYSERAKRILRHGMPHDVFVKKLWEAVLTETSRSFTILTDDLDGAFTTEVDSDKLKPESKMSTPNSSNCEVQFIQSKSFGEVFVCSLVTLVCVDEEDCSNIKDRLSFVGKQLVHLTAKNESPSSSPFFGWSSPNITSNKRFLMKEYTIHYSV
ncbi:hypothetical protein J6590_063995 [Homalodisca vitripennis]|nr:hypothetical protein J6590_063995 [Homalodisca vitripennis]